MLLPLLGWQNQWFWFRVYLQKQTIINRDKLRIKHQNHIQIYACFLGENLGLF